MYFLVNNCGQYCHILIRVSGAYSTILIPKFAIQHYACMDSSEVAVSDGLLLLLIPPLSQRCLVEIASIRLLLAAAFSTRQLKVPIFLARFHPNFKEYPGGKSGRTAISLYFPPVLREDLWLDE
ncbi:hypothetical protein TNCV_295941 [Trichonephila clavipes]|nr:hypothetical protein TNCV_295941 [Trichonephila clavipes]